MKNKRGPVNHDSRHISWKSKQGALRLRCGREEKIFLVLFSILSLYLSHHQGFCQWQSKEDQTCFSKPSPFPSKCTLLQSWRCSQENPPQSQTSTQNKLPWTGVSHFHSTLTFLLHRHSQVLSALLLTACHGLTILLLLASLSNSKNLNLAPCFLHIILESSWTINAYWAEKSQIISTRKVWKYRYRSVISPFLQTAVRTVLFEIAFC